MVSRAVRCDWNKIKIENQMLPNYLKVLFLLNGMNHSRLTFNQFTRVTVKLLYIFVKKITEIDQDLFEIRMHKPIRNL